MLVGLLIVALVVAVSYGLYKHYGWAAIKAEVAQLEHESILEPDKVKAEVVARLKAIL